MTRDEKWVTAAYVVVFAVVLLYVLLIALKLRRMDRQVSELERRAEAAEESEQREPASVG